MRFTINCLFPGKNYDISIYAENRIGWSDKGLIYNFYAESMSPEPPINLTASLNSDDFRKVTLTWIVPYNNGKIIRSYDIYILDINNIYKYITTVVNSPAVIDITYIELNNCTFGIKARNDNGYSMLISSNTIIRNIKCIVISLIIIIK